MATAAPKLDHPSPRYIANWDHYFLGIAQAASLKSKDKRCQVGAAVVSTDDLVISTGFNGFARGVYDLEEMLENVDEKLKWMCHAEYNAILNAVRIGGSLKGGRIYVTKFPCFGCLNTIVQSGLRGVYTMDNRYWDEDAIDPDHTRKPKLIDQTKIKIVAPRHPDFADGELFDLADFLNSTPTDAPSNVRSITPDSEDEVTPETNGQLDV